MQILAERTISRSPPPISTARKWCVGRVRHRRGGDVSVVGKCSIVCVPAMAGRQEEPECWQWPCRDDRWIKATDGRRTISLVIIPRDPPSMMAQRIHLWRRERLPVANVIRVRRSFYSGHWEARCSATRRLPFFRICSDKLNNLVHLITSGKIDVPLQWYLLERSFEATMVILPLPGKKISIFCAYRRGRKKLAAHIASISKVVRVCHKYLSIYPSYITYPCALFCSIRDHYS
jgi:hypothetical protein